MIEVETPDGIVEFPDGTPKETMVAAMRKRFPTATVGTPQGIVNAEGNTVVDRRQPGEQKMDRSGFLSGLDAGVRGAAAGVTGNFADEIASAANAVVPLDALTGKDVATVYDGNGFWDAFNKNMATEKSISANDAEQNPINSGVGNVAGTIGGAVLGGRALGAVPGIAAAAEGVSPVARATLAGAGGGAVAGAGEGDTLENRARSAGGGLVLGGAGGAAVGAVANSLAPAVARYGRILFGRGSDREATRQIVTALARDGYDVTSPTGVLNLKRELESFTGKPVSLADIGASTRARAGVGLRSPSAAQQPAITAVEQRAMGAGDRLNTDITDTVAPRTDVHALDDALVAQRSEQALPLRDRALYANGPSAPEAGYTPPVIEEGSNAGLLRALGRDVPEVYAPGVPTVTSGGSKLPIIPEDPILQGLVRLEGVQPHLQAANRLANFERESLLTQGKDASHIPDLLQPGKNLDMRSLDYLKRYLDGAVDRAFRSTDSATRAEAGQLRNVRDAIKERMRAVGETTPGAGDGPYGQYLDSYSSESDMIDALRAGRGPHAGEPAAPPGFDKLDPERIAAEQGKRSTAAQEFYRVGAARNLQDVVNGTRSTGNPARNLLPTPESERRLAATGADADGLALRVAQERQLAQLPAELQGAQTAQRITAAADANAELPTIPFNIGSPLGWVGALGKAGLNRARPAANAAVNEQLLPRLLETDPAAINRIVDQLAAAGRVQEANELARAAKAATTARFMGAAIGGPAALTEGN